MAANGAMPTAASILANPDPQVLSLFIGEPLAVYKNKSPPRLLDQVRIAIRTRHYSRRTEKAYVGWIRRYILFHGKRHPTLMGEREVTDFLSHLATGARVSASTQNQALSALLFLYKEVLGQNLGWLNDVVRAQHRKKQVRMCKASVREGVFDPDVFDVFFSSGGIRRNGQAPVWNQTGIVARLGRARL